MGCCVIVVAHGTPAQIVESGGGKRSSRIEVKGDHFARPEAARIAISCLVAEVDCKSLQRIVSNCWLRDVIGSIAEVRDRCTGETGVWIVIKEQVANEAGAIVRHGNGHTVIRIGVSNRNYDATTSVDRAEVVIQVERHGTGFGTQSDGRCKQRCQGGGDRNVQRSLHFFTPGNGWMQPPTQVPRQSSRALILRTNVVLRREHTLPPGKCSDKRSRSERIVPVNAEPDELECGEH